MLRPDEDEVRKRFRLIRVERDGRKLEPGAHGSYGFAAAGKRDLAWLCPNVGDGWLKRAQDRREKLVGDPGVGHGILAGARLAWLGRAEHATAKTRAILEMHRVVLMPEKARLLGDFRLIRRRRLAHENTPLVQIHADPSGVLKLKFEIQQVGRARFVTFIETEGFLGNQTRWQLGDENHLFPGNGILRLVGVGDVLKVGVPAGKAADRPGAVAVCTNACGFAANGEFRFKIRIFYAATNVCKREGDFVILEDEGFLLGRRRWRLDGELAASGLWGGWFRSEALLERSILCSLLFFGNPVLPGEIKVGGEQSATNGENCPSFSVVHGGVWKRLVVRRFAVAGTRIRNCG
ncbi:MAG: hypothetical protein RLZZ245_3820 [Verrucomicrobiota bacterium]